MRNEDQILAIVDTLLDADLNKPGPTFRKIAERVVNERNEERRRILRFLKSNRSANVDDLIEQIKSGKHADD